MTYYERNLPHWHPDGRSLFITWRLFGSLPADVISKIKVSGSGDDGKQFRDFDSELDRGRCGPVWLKNRKVADCVMEAIQKGSGVLRLYELHAFVVMANHVHFLITPKVVVQRITNGLKGVTAREANVILGRIGKRFWQGESFDHWVRNAAEMERIRSYVERNPVSAGLVGKAEDWRWSSAYDRVEK